MCVWTGIGALLLSSSLGLLAACADRKQVILIAGQLEEPLDVIVATVPKP